MRSTQFFWQFVFSMIGASAFSFLLSTQIGIATLIATFFATGYLAKFHSSLRRPRSR